MLKDYDGIITKRLNLRCVLVKYGRRCKGGAGTGRKKKQVDIIGNYENGIKWKTKEICGRDKKTPGCVKRSRV